MHKQSISKIEKGPDRLDLRNPSISALLLTRSSTLCALVHLSCLVRRVTYQSYSRKHHVRRAGVPISSGVSLRAWLTARSDLFGTPPPLSTKRNGIWKRKKKKKTDHHSSPSSNFSLQSTSKTPSSTPAPLAARHASLLAGQPALHNFHSPENPAWAFLPLFDFVKRAPAD